LNPHRTEPPQASAGEPPERADAWVCHDDFVRLACKSLTHNELFRPATGEEKELEVNVIVPFNREAGLCQVLAREIAADLIPQHRTGVAAALRLRLLRDQPQDREPGATLGAPLGELTKRLVGPRAVLIQNEGVSAFASHRHVPSYVPLSAAGFGLTQRALQWMWFADRKPGGCTSDPGDEQRRGYLVDDLGFDVRVASCAENAQTVGGVEGRVEPQFALHGC
jgi:hypothetical protein